MRKRKKMEVKSIGFRCPIDLLARVDARAKLSGMNRTEFLNKALHLLLTVCAKRSGEVTPISTPAFARSEIEYIKLRMAMPKDKLRKLKGG